MQPESLATIWLVRHGESVWNRAGRIQGQCPEAPGLTPLGREQVAQCAAALSGAGVQLVIASDLTRAAETGQILAESLEVPLVLDARLRERALGVAEGRAAANVGDVELGLDPPVVKVPNRAPVGAESLSELYRRAAAFFGDLARDLPARRLVLATHGGFLRVAQAVLDRTPLEEMTWTPIHNAEFVQAVLSASALRGASA